MSAQLHTSASRTGVSAIAEPVDVCHASSRPMLPASMMCLNRCSSVAKKICNNLEARSNKQVNRIRLTHF